MVARSASGPSDNSNPPPPVRAKGAGSLMLYICDHVGKFNASRSELLPERSHQRLRGVWNHDARYDGPFALGPKLE